MPIKVDNNLPAKQVLKQENIFVMDEDRAMRQDIRPLQIAILNLMPLKQATETQLLRLLSNTPLQVEITLLHPESYESKNTSKEHLLSFYTIFKEIRHRKFDGMIITGAPVEHMDYEQVGYWDELKEIMEWTKTNVTSTFHICWGAQAGLYYHYGVNKHMLSNKMFGIFEHNVLKPNYKLLRGFNDSFFVPHSRHTGINREDIINNPELELLSESNEAGVYIVMSKDAKQIFVTGHSEYDPLTLKQEYFRDKEKGMDVKLPKNYFPYDDENQYPKVSWRAHAHLIYSNWLNYYVYQQTPYLMDEIGEES
ncbi:homoserine O-acetyltransferase MetA [Vallitalea sp.]|jgi:homoserine O-succinyltransferase|uniref:homoserine O-acetyltransferase MetA n=1 Tax=Vallitalea sp. TaxID=1882829 RepID=UPI0025D73628|nr:homoserine O-succinyltransferase [Vallitalea sp.]MCT4687569.1 homoserine O-succinyltransferase [Vallitalea sp.]